MSKKLKSFILAVSIFYGSILHAGPLEDFREGIDACQKETLITATVAVGIAGIVCVGAYKLISYAYYYNVDHTPTKVFLARSKLKTKSIKPFLEDYNSYLETPRELPLIIDRRCLDSFYPTLDYYDVLSHYLKDLQSIYEALQRKKNKQTQRGINSELEETLTNLYILIETIENYKNTIKKSNKYMLENHAKYYSGPHVQTIIINNL